jgi:hypothetical protein
MRWIVFLFWDPWRPAGISRRVGDLVDEASLASPSHAGKIPAVPERNTFHHRLNRLFRLNHP